MIVCLVVKSLCSGMFLSLADTDKCSDVFPLELNTDWIEYSGELLVTPLLQTFPTISVVMHITDVFLIPFHAQATVLLQKCSG